MSQAFQYICARCIKSGFGQSSRSKFRSLLATRPSYLLRTRNYCSTKSLQTHSAELTTPTNHEQRLQEVRKPRRKTIRPPAVKNSLRRVALEAQRSRDTKISGSDAEAELASAVKIVTAYAVAEQFDLAKVTEMLQEKGYEPDPMNTGLYPQVVHIQVPAESIYRAPNLTIKDLSPDEIGDIFVFPSGTVVTWGLPEAFTSYFATRTLLPAAENAHINALETEELEYVEDHTRKDSEIKGDTIVLGTRRPTSSDGSESLSSSVNTVLTKVALSSGFARSTKLAVLETLLTDYIDSTRNIPTLLSKGSRLPFNRAFILRKTGQLLSLRAQLNLYSELTDSLPDLLWDSKQELKLEGYYDQVGRALDVGIRIKVLNEKMDYAQEIASVLRERLSEKHGLFLEWTIIILIAVEVGFEVLRLWKESSKEIEQRKGEMTLDAVVS